MSSRALNTTKVMKALTMRRSGCWKIFRLSSEVLERPDDPLTLPLRSAISGCGNPGCGLNDCGECGVGSDGDLLPDWETGFRDRLESLQELSKLIRVPGLDAVVTLDHNLLFSLSLLSAENHID